MSHETCVDLYSIGYPVGVSCLYRQPTELVPLSLQNLRIRPGSEDTTKGAIMRSHQELMFLLLLGRNFFFLYSIPTKAIGSIPAALMHSIWNAR